MYRRGLRVYQDADKLGHVVVQAPDDFQQQFFFDPPCNGLRRHLAQGVLQLLDLGLHVFSFAPHLVLERA